MGFLGGNLICPWDDGKMFKLKQFISRLFHIEILRSTKEMHVENPFQLFQSWTKTGQRNPATSQKKGHLLHLLTLRTTWINQTEPFLKSSYWTTVLEIFAKEGVMHSLVAVDCGFIHCSGGSVQVLLVQCFIYIGRDGWKRRWCWSRTSRESKKHMMGINIKGLSQMDSNDYKSRLILAGAGDFRPAKFRKSVPAKIEHLWFNHSGTQTLRRFSTTTDNFTKLSRVTAFFGECSVHPKCCTVTKNPKKQLWPSSQALHDWEVQNQKKFRNHRRPTWQQNSKNRM